MKRNLAIVWRELYKDIRSKTVLIMYIFLIIYNILSITRNNDINKSLYNMMSSTFLISIFYSVISYENIENLLSLPRSIYDFCIAKTSYIMLKSIAAGIINTIFIAIFNNELLVVNFINYMYLFLIISIFIYTITFFIQTISLLLKKKLKFVVVIISSTIIYILDLLIFEVGIKFISIVIISLSLYYISYIILRNMDKEKLIKRSM